MSMREAAGKPLPKFGEWDVNNPASADGFTVIFSKARDEKKGGASNADTKPQQTFENNDKAKNSSASKRKWFCFI